MSEETPSYDVTIPGTDPAAIPPWPLSNVGPDGTTYWVDSTGEVFSPLLHIGPADDPLGVDDAGRWVPLRKRRRGRPRTVERRRPGAPIAQAEMAILAPRPYQDAPCWIVWQTKEAEILLASFDPERVLDFLATNLAEGVRLFKVVRFE